MLHDGPGRRNAGPAIVGLHAMRQLRRYVCERHGWEIRKQLPPLLHLISSQLIETLEQRVRCVDRVLGVTYILRPLVILDTKQDGPQLLNREPNDRVPRVNNQVRRAKRWVLRGEDRATEHGYAVWVRIEGATGGLHALSSDLVPHYPGSIVVIDQTSVEDFVTWYIQVVFDS